MNIAMLEVMPTLQAAEEHIAASKADAEERGDA
jgi:hypothetical protein